METEKKIKTITHLLILVILLCILYTIYMSTTNAKLVKAAQACEYRPTVPGQYCQRIITGYPIPNLSTEIHSYVHVYSTKQAEYKIGVGYNTNQEHKHCDIVIQREEEVEMCLNFHDFNYFWTDDYKW